MSSESKMAWHGDHLERKAVAEFLTDHIDARQDIKVVNIDSRWGTGKTFFLRNWRLGIHNKRPVVYFNAWENDYSGDPLISMVANVRDQLQQYQKAGEVFEERSKQLLKTAGAAIKSATPVLIGGVLNRYLGVDLEKVAGGLEGDVAEKFIEKLIESNEKSRESVEQFKQSLSKLFSSVQIEGKPVYIFIDELDRCRPTYAIELLERVKHFFDVEGCAFIIASDTEQLANSVCAVYGEKFSSKEYLKRFFDLVYSFENPNLERWISERFNVDIGSQLDRAKGAHIKAPNLKNLLIADKLTDAQYIILLLAKTFDVDLRQLERIIHRLDSAYDGTSVMFFYVAYLTFLLDKDKKLFNEYVNGSSRQVMQDLETLYKSSFRVPMYEGSISAHEIAGQLLKVRMATRQEHREILESGGFHEMVGNVLVLVHNRQVDLSRYSNRVLLSSGIN